MTIPDSQSVPLVSCVCPTRGRFCVLQEALACFEQQDYPNRELVILNNHPEPLHCTYPDVRVYNEPEDMPLGAYYNRLVELAEGTYLRIWEDDDLYLPWNISQAVEHIGDAPVWKPKWSWSSEHNEVYKLEANCMEASLLIQKDFALNHRFSLKEHWCEPVFRASIDSDLIVETDVGWEAPYVFRWDTGIWHHSGRMFQVPFEELNRSYREHNNDTGNGSALEAADVSKYWKLLLKDAPRTLGPGAKKLEHRLREGGYV